MSNPAADAKKGEVRRLINEIYQKNLIEGQERITELAGAYKRKYADCLDCDLYHTMIGSTPRTQPLRPDFPGSDAVAKRLQEILKSIPPE